MMVMLSMCVIIDIALVSLVNYAIFQWKNDVHFFNKTNDIKRYRVTCLILKFPFNVEAGTMVYYDFDIVFNRV